MGTHLLNEDRLSQAMRAAQNGDELAYKELLSGASIILRAYVRRVLNRMGKIQSGLEDDLVQEVLLALHQKRHTYDSSLPFLPWLFAIARYKLIDYGRREKRKPPAVSLQSVEDALVTPIFTESTTPSDLDSLISTLPPKTRILLELVKLKGLSIAEAAARTNMSESATKVAIHRALKGLRARFGKGDGV